MLPAPRSNRLQRALFTAAVLNIGRALALRDRLQGRVSSIPSSAGVSRHIFPSGNNRIDAVLVSPGHKPRAALLICHGIGETVEHWTPAQQLLARHDIASLIFNYSGCGRSTGLFTAAQCERDAIAAFEWLRRALPSTPITLLGFSLGTGVAAATTQQVRPESLILCEAYLSFREAARRFGLPRMLSSFSPPVWQTERTLATLDLPILIVHGEHDRLFPVQMAEALALACPARGRLVIIPGMTHSDLHAQPREEHWKVIIEQLEAQLQAIPDPEMVTRVLETVN